MVSHQDSKAISFLDCRSNIAKAVFSQVPRGQCWIHHLSSRSPAHILPHSQLSHPSSIKLADKYLHTFTCTFIQKSTAHVKTYSYIPAYITYTPTNIYIYTYTQIDLHTYTLMLNIPIYIPINIYLSMHICIYIIYIYKAYFGDFGILGCCRGPWKGR